ncbi:sulfurtransferase complex subunit TusB [Paramixta manurensis]|uniref:Protein TusB n=1 Tax=Paramixta manurensis TaxID=2740817 RepID=A0A6M8U3X3_9GAMM|nr:sulfurtransferase complex subunit TusB [Erwiniaceae bacterium PD-1]
MLHTLMHSPAQCDFALLLRMLKAGDDLLLMQDGVIAGVQGSLALEKLLQSPAHLYILREDVDARGLFAQISNSTTLVDYTDFVALTVKQPQQMTW